MFYIAVHAVQQQSLAAVTDIISHSITFTEVKRVKDLKLVEAWL